MSGWLILLCCTGVGAGDRCAVHTHGDQHRLRNDNRKPSRGAGVPFDGAEEHYRGVETPLLPVSSAVFRSSTGHLSMPRRCAALCWSPMLGKPRNHACGMCGKGLAWTSCMVVRPPIRSPGSCDNTSPESPPDAMLGWAEAHKLLELAGPIEHAQRWTQVQKREPLVVQGPRCPLVVRGPR